VPWCGARFFPAGQRRLWSAFTFCLCSPAEPPAATSPLNPHALSIVACGGRWMGAVSGLLSRPLPPRP
jgi:hypothetical protein